MANFMLKFERSGFNKWRDAAIEIAATERLLVGVLNRMFTAQLGKGWNAWLFGLKQLDAEEAAMKVVVRALNRLFHAQLSAGVQKWRDVVRYDKSCEDSHAKAAALMVRTISRMMLAQLGAGWVAWRDVIKAQHHLESEQARAAAVMVSFQRFAHASIASAPPSLCLRHCRQRFANHQSKSAGALTLTPYRIFTTPGSYDQAHDVGSAWCGVERVGR